MLPRVNEPLSISKKYERFQRNSGTLTTLNYQEFLMMKRQIKFLPLDKTLPHYVLTSSRTRNFSPDLVIYIKNNLIRKILIDWRRGLALNRKFCQECSSKFNRRCLLNCGYFLRLPPIFRRNNLYEIFYEQKNTIQEDARKNHWLYEGCKTFIDTLINVRYYIRAFKLMDYLSKNTLTRLIDT